MPAIVPEKMHFAPHQQRSSIVVLDANPGKARRVNVHDLILAYTQQEVKLDRIRVDLNKYMVELLREGF